MTKHLAKKPGKDVYVFTTSVATGRLTQHTWCMQSTGIMQCKYLEIRPSDRGSDRRPTIL